MRMQMFSEESFHTLFNLAADCMLILDAGGFIKEINHIGHTRLGYTKAEMLGKHVSQFILPGFAELVGDRMAEIQKQGYLVFESAQVSKDGSVLPVEINSRAIELDGEKTFFSVIRDISERKRLDHDLRESEARFRTLVADAPEAIVIHDLDSGLFVDATTSAERLFACSRDEILRHGPEYFYPPDQPSASPSVASIRERGARILAGEQMKFERRVRNAKGQDIHCEVRLVRLPSANRKLIRASYIDITERKQAEEKLRLASLALHNSSEGLMITDASNQIVAINPAFSSITGYSFDEVKGKNPLMFKSGRHDLAFYRAMWHTLTTTGQWQGEIWDKRKNGEIHAKWLTINTICNDDGSIHRYVALFSDITEKKQSEELIWKQANFDALTGLPNRDMFRDRLQQEVKKSNRAGQPLALLLVDLDQFKEVNDTLGHAAGDMLLKEAARRISTCVRESDTVARLGGDEFTIVLPEVTDNSHAEDLAQKIIRKLAEPFKLDGEVVYISASIGITLYPSDATNIDVLMKNADQAMYAAKDKGRNRFSYFTASLQEAAQKRLRLTNDLRGALEARQFSVHFQPIIELSTGCIHKAEALVRWQHPERGLISPTEFIPLAEETGMINEIGGWVFKESARWAQFWSNLRTASCQVSVNMSPVQFQHGGRICGEWVEYLRALGLSGQNIVIEITEGLLLNSEPDVTDNLLKFRDAGIQVAIDDFGTGYSSLSYLKKFDIDYLKIDQSFVKNLETDENDMALSEAIIVMAHKLGLKVIAEGVETEGQRNLLAAAGCDYAQGYLFSEPVPPEEFESLLNRLGQLQQVTPLRPFKIGSI